MNYFSEKPKITSGPQFPCSAALGLVLEPQLYSLLVKLFVTLWCGSCMEKKRLDKDKYVCSIWNIPSMPSSAVWFLVFYRYFLYMHACKHTLIWVCVHLEVRHLVNSPHFTIRLTWENECCTIFRLQSISNIYIDIKHQCKLSRRKTLWTPTCHAMGNHWETSCRALRSWSGCTGLMKQ